MVLSNLVGPLLFLIGVVFMFLLVPMQRIRDLFNVGLVGGLAVALLLIFLMQNVLGFWNFRTIDLVNPGGVPFFIALSWLPFIIAFSHLLAQYHNTLLITLLLLAFPLGTVLVHLIFLYSRSLAYSDWNLFLTFFVSLAIHLALTLYLYLTGRLENFKKAEIT